MFGQKGAVKSGTQEIINGKASPYPEFLDRIGWDGEADWIMIEDHIISDIEEENRAPVVSGAHMKCSLAKAPESCMTVYAAGESFEERAGGAALKATDIAFDQGELGECRKYRLPQMNQCVPHILDGCWQACCKDEITGEESVIMSSYLLCERRRDAVGILTLVDDGQVPEEVEEEMEEEIVEETEEETEDEEIVDLKIVIYELAEQGGLDAVMEYLDTYCTEDINTFLYMIEQRESTGNSRAINGSFIGRYQMGPKAFLDIGWLHTNEYNSWTKEAKSFGISSLDDFLNSPDAQKVAMILYLRREYMTVLNFEEELQAINEDIEMVGVVFNGPVRKEDGTKENQNVEVTLSGLMAAVHLVGIGSVEDEYKDYAERGDTKWTESDNNETYATEYMYEFGGYDITKLLGYVRNKENV